MQNTFSVHFVVRNDRVDEDGNAPIYAKITLNGKKLFFTVNHKILQKHWNTKKGSPLTQAPNYSIIYETIQALTTRIYKAHSKLISSTESFSLEDLKQEILGKVLEKEKAHLLIETTIEHNTNFEALIGIKYSQGSYKNYKSSLKYYIEFVPEFFKKRDIPLSLVNYKFCEAFFMWLTTRKNCKTNGANKQIQRLKKIVHYAMNKGYIITDPLVAYALVNTPVNKIALTYEELQRLHSITLNRPVLKEVRDVFLIQAYTGLSYGDVKRLTLDDVQLDGKGDYWIRMSRQKTLIAFSVPLLAPAALILEDYLKIRGPAEPLLPVLSIKR